jgi:hypothetical protein
MRSSTSGATHAGTAVSDSTYDLISVMYHALQGCQTYERYAHDAEQAGQQELAQFFRDTGWQFERCAERGRQLLAQCLQHGAFAKGERSGRQLSSQMGSSGQQGQGLSAGSHGQGGSPGQQTQMGSSHGQQGSGSYGSRGAASGSSDSTRMDSSASSSMSDGSSALEGGMGRSSGSRTSGSRGSNNR